MLAGWPSLCRRSVLVAAWIATTSGVASVGRTQQVSGSIGASLTILAPLPSAQPRITGIAAGRDGVVRIEATLAEPSGIQRRESGGRAMSRLVMARVFDSAASLTTDAQPSSSPGLGRGEQRLLHVVRLRRIPRASDAQPMELRVEYVIFAGT